LLHDSVEDQKISPETIAAQFGGNVAKIVLEVTDDKSFSREARKAAQIATACSKSHAAKLIRLADKISNARAVAISPPVDWPKQRRRDYIEFCTAVVDKLRGTSPVLEVEFDAAREMALFRLGGEKKSPTARKREKAHELNVDQTVRDGLTNCGHG
jgi:guanosine-3',5'-bis(diphosphate) 3'-pyrophosphohydrolase